MLKFTDSGGMSVEDKTIRVHECLVVYRKGGKQLKRSSYYVHENMCPLCRCTYLDASMCHRCKVKILAIIDASVSFQGHYTAGV